MDARDELVVTVVAEGDVPFHRQVRAVDLEQETGGDHRFVLRLHRCGDRFEIGVFGVVVLVQLEGCDDPGRRGVDEGIAVAVRQGVA